MSDDLNPAPHFMKKMIVWLFVLIFGITAYFGYRFIVEAERSAAGIPTPSFNKNQELDFSKLDNQIPLPTHRQLPAERMPSGNVFSISSGSDLLIKAGEFAYRNSQLVVRLALYNQGRFPMNSASLNVSLFLNDEKEAVAGSLGIPIALSQTLLPDGNVVVSIPIVGDEWHNDDVRHADTRRILAQIVAVNDTDGSEYAQTSQGVYLKQTGNDWSRPDPLAPPSDFASQTAQNPTPPPDFADPTAGMDLTAPPTVQGVKIEPVHDFKLPPMPESLRPRMTINGRMIELENNQNSSDKIEKTEQIEPLENPVFRQPEHLSPTQNVLPEENSSENKTP